MGCIAEIVSSGLCLLFSLMITIFRYSAGPLIDLEQQVCDEEVSYGHGILVCSDCRLKR